MLTVRRIAQHLIPTVPEREVLAMVWDINPDALPYWGA